MQVKPNFIFESVVGETEGNVTTRHNNDSPHNDLPQLDQFNNNDLPQLDQFNNNDSPQFNKDSPQV